MQLEPKSVESTLFFSWVRSSFELMMRRPLFFILLSVISVLLSIGIRKFANIPVLYSLYQLFMVMICGLGVIIAEAADKGNNPISMILGVSKNAWSDLLKIALALTIIGIAISLFSSLLISLASGHSLSLFFQFEPYESTSGYMFIEGGRVCRHFATGVIMFMFAFLCLPSLLINLKTGFRIGVYLSLAALRKNYWIAFYPFPVLYILYHFIGFYFGILAFVLVPFIVCLIYVSYRSIFLGIDSNDPVKKSTSIAVATAH